jgi:hypothetical protein
MSSEVGFEFFMKARSRATLTALSIDVRFFRRFPIRSWQAGEEL